MLHGPQCCSQGCGMVEGACFFLAPESRLAAVPRRFGPARCSAAHHGPGKGGSPERGSAEGGKREGDLTAATAHFTACHALMAEEIKAGMELFIEINQSPRRRGENNIASSVIPAQPRGGCHRRSPGSWTRLVLSLGAAEPPLSPLGCPEQLVGRDEMGATGSRIWGMDVWVPRSGCIASKGRKMRFAMCRGP